MSNRRPKSSGFVSFAIALVYDYETGEILGVPSRTLYAQSKAAPNGVVWSFHEPGNNRPETRESPCGDDACDCHIPPGGGETSGRRIWGGYERGRGQATEPRPDEEAKKVFVG